MVNHRFYESCIVLNAGKCHFMCLGNNTENEPFLFNNNNLKENSNKRKVLRAIIDNKLNFKSHIN